jgi:hypothetical protein
MKQAIVLASGVAQLRAVMTDDLVRTVFMPLQGTTLGFLTDKDQRPKDAGPDWRPGYPVHVVREVMIEAMISGVRPIGNELNIISSRMYVAKNGLQRMVMTHPGVTDMVITPGVPHMVGPEGALVPMRATWKLNGVPQVIAREFVKRPDGVVSDTRIPIRVNRSMGTDAILGKAMRKIFKAIYDRLVGNNSLTIDDGDAIDTVGETMSSDPSTQSPAETMAQVMDETKAPPSVGIPVTYPVEPEPAKAAVPEAKPAPVAKEKKAAKPKADPAPPPAAPPAAVTAPVEPKQPAMFPPEQLDGPEWMTPIREARTVQELDDAATDAVVSFGIEGNEVEALYNVRKRQILDAG